MNIGDLKEVYLPIPAKVTEYAMTWASGGTCFIKWLESYKNELMIRTFAYRQLKRKPFEITEVERALIGQEYAIRKNLYKTQMGGYHAVFSPKQQASSKSWYGYTYYYFSPDDFNIWYCDKVAGMFSPIINTDYLYTLPKYKYCGYSGKQDLKEYLEAYNKDPAVEYFGKAGLKYTALLARKAKKDKQFAKFIIANANKVNNYGYKITEYAYTHKCSFAEAEIWHVDKTEADHMFRGFTKVDYKVDRIKIYNYAKRVLGRWNYEGTYRDYWNACVALGYDMRDTKNSMPKDFNEMHDLRTDQFEMLKDKLNKKAAAEFNKKIKAQAEKYNVDVQSKKYEVVLPKTKRDFILEGQALNHCVGRMNYDKRMAEGEIIIAFIRLKSDPKQHYVTVEYNLKRKELIQEHGKNNVLPDKSTKEFIRKWVKEVRRLQQCQEKAI